MRIEQQTCTPEQSKTLSLLGINADSYFLFGSDGRIVERWTVDGTEDQFTPAFTSAELGTMLPHLPVDTKWAQVATHWSFSEPDKALCQIDYSSRHEVIPAVRFKAATEAQARAEMLIFLLEQKKVTAEEINKRLIHGNN
jgi:hypothetical protein